MPLGRICALACMFHSVLTLKPKHTRESQPIASRSLQAATGRPTPYWTTRPTASPTIAPTRTPTLSPTPCPEGHYYFFYTRSCTICLFGQYLNTPTSCDFCPHGYYGDTRVSSRTCFQPVEKATDSSCLLCKGATECKACRPGTFNKREGAMYEELCKKCPGGKYTPAFGSPSCKECPQGKYTPPKGACTLLTTFEPTPTRICLLTFDIHRNIVFVF
jgi:hypothetical protein